MRTKTDREEKEAPKAKAAAKRPLPIKESSSENFLPVFWEVDRSLPIDQRPLTGADIRWFATRHKLKLNDVIYALCIQNSAKYNEVLRLPALPFTLELLIRLYDQYPGHSPWARITPKQAFETLYGDNMKQFAGHPREVDVRRALYWRFTASLGRSIYTALRWIKDGGEAKPQILKIFSKLTEAKDPRKALEDIATLMFRVRNEDLNLKYPLPTLEQPPVPRRRGPPRKSERLAAEAAAAAQLKKLSRKRRLKSPEPEAAGLPNAGGRE